MTADIPIGDSNELEQRPTFPNFEEDDEDEQPISSSSASSIPADPSGSSPIDDQFDGSEVKKLYADWIELDTELRSFEPKHKEYVRKLDEVESLKTKYKNEFIKYKKKIGQIEKDFENLKKTHPDGKTAKQRKWHLTATANNLKSSQSSTSLTSNKHSSEANNLSSYPSCLTSVNSSSKLNQPVEKLTPHECLDIMSEKLPENNLFLSRISNTLPNKDRYLKIILGGVDVSILNKADKWTYKQEYEKFKFIVTCISLVSSLVIWSLTSRFRAFDAMFHFLLVWYYCTLTIRESILIINGSNINPWWRAHHFIATVATGILLTWPDSPSYQSFRTQFFVFSFYLSFVQGLQFYYQRGCLYRLRALGETHDMDITIEGFHRWMFRGLSFLVPFLLCGYLFQLYNAYTLWKLAHQETTHEWQVYVLAIIFFVLFLGNILTTLSVLREKFREKVPTPLLKQKYQSFKTFLSTNYHKRSRSFNQLRSAQQCFNTEDESRSPSKEE